MQYITLLDFKNHVLSCPLSSPFFSKLHKQRRLTRVPIVFLERSGVQVSICRNDAREVLAGWWIAKKPHDLLEKNRVLSNQGGRSREKNVFMFAFALYLNGSSTSN